jgi:hypothetical protein
VRFEPSSGYSKFENINAYQIASLKLKKISVGIRDLFCGNLFISISHRLAQIIEAPEADFDCNRHRLGST